MSILSSNGRSVLTMRLARSADAFAIGAATALPWSKTATSILIVLWLIALVPTLNLTEVRREIASPNGRPADPVVCSWFVGHGLGKCELARTIGWIRFVHQISVAAAFLGSVSPLQPRHLGHGRLPRLLHCAAGAVFDLGGVAGGSYSRQISAS